MGRQDRDDRGVGDVVGTGHVEHHAPGAVGSVKSEIRVVSRDSDIAHPPLVLTGADAYDLTRGDARDALTSLVVTPHDDRTAGALDELGEGALERPQRAVVVEVVGLDIEQSQGVRVHEGKGAVALVNFHHDVAPAPVTVGADAEHVGAEESSGVAALGGHDVDHHRGRGGLAVRAGQSDEWTHPR